MRPFLPLLLAVFSMPLLAEPCITQSAMQPADRDSLVHAGDHACLHDGGQQCRGRPRPDDATVCAGFQRHPRRDPQRSATPAGCQFRAGDGLDPRCLRTKAGPDGSPQDVQFFCTLNRTAGRDELPDSRTARRPLRPGGAEYRGDHRAVADRHAAASERARNVAARRPVSPRNRRGRA